MAWACKPGPGMGRPWSQGEEAEGCRLCVTEVQPRWLRRLGGGGGLCARKDGTAGGAPEWQLRWWQQVGGRGDGFGLGGGEASGT